MSKSTFEYLSEGRSEDRLSLAQEIVETLRSRGHWVPHDWAGPDLINAVGMALDKEKEMSNDVYEDEKGVRKWRATGEEAPLTAVLTEAEKEIAAAFVLHANDRGPYLDGSARPEDGDDTSYYELDARVVEPLLRLLGDPSDSV